MATGAIRAVKNRWQCPWTLELEEDELDMRINSEDVPQCASFWIHEMMGWLLENEHQRAEMFPKHWKQLQLVCQEKEGEVCNWVKSWSDPQTDDVKATLATW